MKTMYMVRAALFHRVGLINKVTFIAMVFGDLMPYFEVDRDLFSFVFAIGQFQIIDQKWRLAYLNANNYKVCIIIFVLIFFF